jgi:hypothetical protein
MTETDKADTPPSPATPAAAREGSLRLSRFGRASRACVGTRTRALGSKLSNLSARYFAFRGSSAGLA